MRFAIIAAIDAQRGIGKDGKIPWKLPADMEFFRSTTVAAPGKAPNAVVMGRRTWLSLPKKFQPLPDRINAVISPEPLEAPEGVIVAANLTDALQRLGRHGHIGDVFVIGGGMVYESAILHPECDTLYLTEIDRVFDCDTFFPAVPDFFKEVSRTPEQEQNGMTFSFVTYRRQGAETPVTAALE